MRQNVLLVVLDTARADAFEPYGAPSGSSPTMAQLQRAGAASDATFSTTNWTVPAHGSMFTGLLPRTTGLGRSVNNTPEAFRATMHSHSDRLLATILGRAGYATSGVSTNLWVSPETGFDAGFDHFTFVRAQRSTGHGSGTVRGRLHADIQALRARVDDGARAVEQLIDGWITEQSGQPFFWFVNLVECHSPYLPPKPYNDLSPWQRILASEDTRRHLSLEAIWRTCLGELDVSESALDRMRHLYRQSILLMDDWLARVLESLDRHHLLDETLVIVTSDHGENFGEDGLIGHAFSLDDRLIRVPVITAGPGHELVASMRSLVSLPRLVGDAVGLTEHPWEADGRIEDVAVAQLDAPLEPGTPAAAEAIERWGLGDHALARFVSSFACATDGALKLVRHGGRDQLIDLEADPLELAPVDVGRAEEATHAGVLARLRAALDRAEETEPLGHHGEVEGARSEPAADEVADLEDRMRLLGYL